jgi:HAD superfamily hydrolase (TIGR01549 family)
VPSPRDFYARWNAIILKHLGITRSLDRLAAEIDRQWFSFSRSHLYPEVKKSLNRLRKMGLRLGLVTSGYELDLEQILPEVGLQEFFDVQVCADTVGKRKPHPEAFVYALKQLGIEPQEAVFVGDNYEIDYLGAQNAGMLPVLIRRDETPMSGVRTIRTLDGIFAVLAKVNG